MGKAKVVMCVWAWDGTRECFVCKSCFGSLVGSGDDVNMNA